MPAAGLPVDKTAAREDAGATADAAAGAEVAITPVERGGMDAVGSATGGRVDMICLVILRDPGIFCLSVKFPRGSMSLVKSKGCRKWNSSVEKALAVLFSRGTNGKSKMASQQLY